MAAKIVVTLRVRQLRRARRARVDSALDVLRNGRGG
jgi:hypothetical protein